MSYLTTIDLYKEDMKFAAGHYTIFSATNREPLHGHNFRVHAQITARTNDLGMAFDYAIYKQKVRKLCRQLNSIFLLAGNSPYQTIETKDNQVIVHFNNEQIPFLSSDVLILPLANITVEELSRWFVEQLAQDKQALETYAIEQITVKVYSAPGQSGCYSWLR